MRSVTEAAALYSSARLESALNPDLRAHFGAIDDGLATPAEFGN
jgi:hypothetical protein